MRLLDDTRKIWRALVVLPALTIFLTGYDFDSARAERKSAARRSAAVSAQSSSWNHNGSVVSLIAEGTKQKIIYQTPRVGLLDAGVKPGTLLFEGHKTKEGIVGTAYQFYRNCKAHGFQVSGEVNENRNQITLKGKAPLLDFNCNITGTRDDVLIFTAVQNAPADQARSAQAAVVPPTASADKQRETVAANPIVEQRTAPAGELSKESKAAAAPVSNLPGEKPDGASEANARLETGRASEASAAKPDDAKSGANPASTALAAAAPAAPKEAAKEVQTAPAPKVESAKAPPNEPVKEAKRDPAKDSPTAANAKAENANTPPSEPAKDAASKPNAGDEKTTGAVKATPAPQVSATLPPSESPKEIQTAAIPLPNAAAKSDEAGKLTSAKVAVSNGAEGDKSAALSDSKIPKTAESEKMMEIVLKNGRILRIGRDIEIEALSRIITLLERQE